jgi:hypothetical protein
MYGANNLSIEERKKTVFGHSCMNINGNYVLKLELNVRPPEEEISSQKK